MKQLFESGAGWTALDAICGQSVGEATSEESSQWDMLCVCANELVCLTTVAAFSSCLNRPSPISSNSISCRQRRAPAFLILTSMETRVIGARCVLRPHHVCVSDRLPTSLTDWVTTTGSRASTTRKGEGEGRWEGGEGESHPHYVTTVCVHFLRRWPSMGSGTHFTNPILGCGLRNKWHSSITVAPPNYSLQ